jgi:hypothetical protein
MKIQYYFLNCTKQINMDIAYGNKLGGFEFKVSYGTVLNP